MHMGTWHAPAVVLKQTIALRMAYMSSDWNRINNLATSVSLVRARIEPLTAQVRLSRQPFGMMLFWCHVQIYYHLRCGQAAFELHKLLHDQWASCSSMRGHCTYRRPTVLVAAVRQPGRNCARPYVMQCAGTWHIHMGTWHALAVALAQTVALRLPYM